MYDNSSNTKGAIMSLESTAKKIDDTNSVIINKI